MPPAGLPGPKVEALLRRFLDGEPGVVVRTLKGGLGFLCGAGFGTDPAPPRLFAVATHGGILLRLDPDGRAKAIENGLGEPNIGLPDWMLRVEDAPTDEETAGTPEEWVWVPIPHGSAFERRRPHIHEALAYCRHCLQTARRR